MTLHTVCRQCAAPFTSDDEDLAFYDRVSPIFNSKKEMIPPPTMCPMCRLQKRMAFRNPISVFSRRSSLSGKSVFSMYPDPSPFPVYAEDEWWRDGWDALTYGRAFDFSRPFFEQFLELRNAVPHPPRSVLNLQNSDFSNNASELKDCYLVFNATRVENSLYGEYITGCKDCVDCSFIGSSELCYDCTACERCYNLQSSEFSDDCSDSFFLAHCRSCKDCFGCANLRHKQYYIFNEQKTKEEYEAFLRSIDLSSHEQREGWHGKAMAFWSSHPRPHLYSTQSENVSGNFIHESRNVTESFFVRTSENVRRGFALHETTKDAQDYTICGIRAELMYESMISGIGAYNVRFCVHCFNNVSDLLYCWFCVTCKDCFGCVGVRNKQYCIFNKQYTEEEYDELVPRIIEHMRESKEWGEFYPIQFAPLPYNISIAQRYFPLAQREVEAKGLSWYAKETESPEGALPAEQLPDVQPRTDDSIVALSALSGRPFRITTQEIKRYRPFGVPLPRVTYDERLELRAAKLGGVRLHERTCAKTGKTLLTCYSPDSPWIIWDKDAYDREFNS